MLGDGAAPEAAEHRELVERFLLRTGRPVPHVLVVGEDLAVRAAQIDELGGAALGICFGDSSEALARQIYPEGKFVNGDVKAPPVDGSSYDGAWTGELAGVTPPNALTVTFAGLHKALRPGGLLFVQLRLDGAGEFIDTSDGQVFRARWSEAEFVEGIGALDFDLIDRTELADNSLGLTFRREY